MPIVPLTCAICNLPMQRARTSAPQGVAAHKDCRGPSTPEKKAAYMKRWHAEHREKTGKWQGKPESRADRGIDPIDCFMCKLPLLNVVKGTARYPLHKNCRTSAPAWMRRGKDKPTPKRDAFQRRIDKAAAGSSGGKRVWTSGPCAWCGDAFVGQGATCSTKCSDSRGRSLRSAAAFKISPRRRVALYERDGWICYLCYLPVDSEVNYLDDWSPTLDHIVPQSHVLIPDHSDSNLKTAHRFCNSLRGDTSYVTDEDVKERALERIALVA